MTLAADILGAIDHSWNAVLACQSLARARLHGTDCAARAPGDPSARIAVRIFCNHFAVFPHIYGCAIHARDLPCRTCAFPQTTAHTRGEGFLLLWSFRSCAQGPCSTGAHPYRCSVKCHTMPVLTCRRRAGRRSVARAVASLDSARECRLCGNTLRAPSESASLTGRSELPSRPIFPPSRPLM
ncbi:MAG: hypothetical protein JWN43_2502 [Gammaproteobacteria bacterium]|nr:hypothetical protein [Gammaproteobacteria bacterium]